MNQPTTAPMTMAMTQRMIRVRSSARCSHRVMWPLSRTSGAGSLMMGQGASVKPRSGPWDPHRGPEGPAAGRSASGSGSAAASGRVVGTVVAGISKAGSSWGRPRPAPAPGSPSVRPAASGWASVVAVGSDATGSVVPGSPPGRLGGRVGHRLGVGHVGDVQGAPQLVLEALGDLAELGQVLAHLPRRVGELVRAEDDQRGDEDDQHLSTTDVEHDGSLVRGPAGESIAGGPSGGLGPRRLGPDAAALLGQRGHRPPRAANPFGFGLEGPQRHHGDGHGHARQTRRHQPDPGHGHRV